MDYVYLFVAVLAAVHAFTYGRWLKRQGNKLGAWAVFLLASVCVALPVYRLVMLP